MASSVRPFQTALMGCASGPFPTSLDSDRVSSSAYCSGTGCRWSRQSVLGHRRVPRLVWVRPQVRTWYAASASASRREHSGPCHLRPGLRFWSSGAAARPAHRRFSARGDAPTESDTDGLQVKVRADDGSDSASPEKGPLDSTFEPGSGAESSRIEEAEDPSLESSAQKFEPSPLRRLDSAARKLVKAIVGTVSGPNAQDRVRVARAQKGNGRGLFRNPSHFLFQKETSGAKPWRNKIADAFRRAETDFFAFSRQLGKYVMIMSGTGAILVAGMELGGGSPHEQGVLGFSWLTGVVIGSMIGAGQVLKEHAGVRCRNVLITGSTRGLGKAIAREFLRHGDNVVITSRNAESVRRTVEEFRKEIQELSGSLRMADAQLELFGLPSPKRKDPRVVGIPCDISKSEDVRALAEYAVQEFGTVDMWINNAGVNKGFRPLLEFSGEEIEQIVSTNLTGSMICTREAMRVMQTQKRGGHIFNMDGAGSGGSSTPLTAAYGATKCGLRQLSSSLLQEVKGSRVGIHTASPGMVLTDLLLSGASLQNKKMFNFICEQPETVARALVPNLRLVNGTGKAVNYLTPARIIFAIVSIWIRRGRYFDEEGQAVYAAEAERLRLWAEGRERSPVTAAMELVPSGTWVSIFSSSVICAYLIMTSASNGSMPGI